MKKILLLPALLLAFSSIVSAQCVPDASITDPGIYPDTTTNLPHGTAGVFYSSDIQVRVLTDTSSGSISVDVVDITIDSVQGLPPGFSYTCSPPNCIFPGGSNGCIQLFGTNAVAGTYDLTVFVTLNGLVFGAFPIAQASTVAGYRIILDPAPPTPAAAFSPNITSLCENGPVSFTDLSTNAPTSWEWSFPGGIPATSPDPNPVVYYFTPGVYDVTLIVSNSNGSDTLTQSALINIVAKPEAKILPNNGVVGICPGEAITLTASAGLNYTYEWSRYGVLLPFTTQSISVSTAGGYKVNVTDPATGCTKRSGIRDVASFPQPFVLMVANGPTTFCQGDSVVLQANNNPGDTYQWYTNNNTAIPGATAFQYVAKQSEFYRVQITNPNGCTKKSPGIIVNRLPAPTAAISASGSLTFCAGDSVVLSSPSVAGSSFQWEKNLQPLSGATANTYTATTAGKYTVNVTGTNNCSRRSAVRKVIINCREMNPVIGQDNEFSVYPNPVSANALIDFSVPAKSLVQINMYDLSGKLVYSVIDEVFEEGSYNTEIDMQHIPSGIYFIKKINSDSVETIKIVKQ